MGSSTPDPQALEQDAGYIEHSGPGFDPQEQITTEFPQVEDPAAGGALQELERWEEETVRSALQGAGEGLHLVVGVGETDWKMTQADLDRIAPPLTRIMNRYEPTARLAPYADPLLVAQGAAQYAFRSMVARKAALAAREHAFEGYAVDDRPAAAPDPADTGEEHQPYVPFAQRGEDQQ